MYSFLIQYSLNYFLGIISTGANISCNFHHLEDKIWDRAVPCFLLRKLQFMDVILLIMTLEFRVKAEKLSPL